MPTITTLTTQKITTPIVPGKGVLVATAGAVPPVTMSQTRADTVSLRVYSHDWKPLDAYRIDDRQAPFEFDLNHLPVGEYNIEFRPYLGGKFHGADRMSFRLDLAKPKSPSDPGQGASDKPAAPSPAHPVTPSKPNPAKGASHPGQGAKPVVPTPHVGGTDTGLPARRAITLQRPYDGPEVVLENLIIDAAGLVVVAKERAVDRVIVKNCEIFNYESLVEITDTFVDVLIEDSVFPDTWRDPSGRTVRKVIAPVWRDGRFVPHGHTLLQPCAVRYVGCYVGDLPGDGTSRVTVRRSHLGSAKVEHLLRAHNDSELRVSDSVLANWANVRKGDHKTFGSAVRAHGATTEIVRTVLTCAKFGHANTPTRSLVLDAVQISGFMQFEGDARSKAKLNAVTLNGKSWK